MNTRVLSGSTRITIVGLITALACAGIWLGHRGLFQLLERDAAGFAGRAVAGLMLGVAAYAVARFRNDLIDEG
jgi:hypothetical protein